MQGSTRDITERRQLEEVIIESRQKYQSVVDTQKEMICRYLPDTTLTFVNVVFDISLAPDLPLMKLLQKDDIRSLAYAALEREGKPMGILLAASTKEEKVLAPDASELLAGIADLAASAIDDAVLFEKLKRTNIDLLKAYDSTIEGWAYALDLKDEETEDHSQRVTDLTMLVAQKMGIKDEELVHVKRGVLLHDIGKMGVPDSILLKPGPLTDEEWEVMRKNPVYAHEMLSRVEYLHLDKDISYE